MTLTRNAQGYIVQKCNIAAQARELDKNGVLKGSWTNVSNDKDGVIQTPFHATAEDAYKALDIQASAFPEVQYRVVRVCAWTTVARPIPVSPFRIGAMYQWNNGDGSNYACAAVDFATRRAVLVPQNLPVDRTRALTEFAADREHWTEVPA